MMKKKKKTYGYYKEFKSLLMTNHTLTLPQTQEPNQVDLTIKQTITFNLHIYKPLLLRSSPSQNNTRGHTHLYYCLGYRLGDV